ncbi:MAG TPA: endonuclease/exonuclease/phosphatase family protein [Ktedonobacteraceae bacterium]|nr:endonuclease/exonuclease/phosphatase family protein [Ktedonobacteraceae bacterium]
MTRILTYNILVGGARRIDQIAQMIRSAHPDVVGLVEATDPRVVKELAERLGMEYRLTGNGSHQRDWQVAALSRLPIVRSRAHTRPGILSKPLLEISVQEEDGDELTLFVTHLTASFSYSVRGGDSFRRAEVREILRIMAEKQGTPHLLMGDLNSLAPGDALKASRLLRYLVHMDELRQAKPIESVGHPNLDFVVPPFLRFLEPLLRMIPRSNVLSALFDWAGSLYAARGSVRLLRRAGYVDSFRRLNSHAWGFTCPANAPAGRIDYIFASPELAGRLSACYVVTEGNGLRGDEASDHLPVVAEFGEHASGERDIGTNNILNADGARPIRI